jgi:hypothetical protein
MTGALVLQRQSLNRVQQENQSLRQQFDDLMARAEQLAAEKQQLSIFIGANQANAGALSPQEASKDVLRLRGEVARLRVLEKAAEQSLRLKMQAAQEQLTNAEVELARLTKLHSEGAMSATDLSRAKFTVEALQAEAKGDMAEVARIRLRQAEEELSRAAELRSSNSLISQTEYDEAVHRVELLRAGTAP